MQSPSIISTRSAYLQEPLLTPSLAPEVAGVLAQTDLLHDLVQAFGSPLNLVLPEAIGRNAQPFLATFRHYNLGGKVFFTSKPNRSAAVLREVATCRELGVDVSSAGSLQAALKEGVSADRLEATGPKNLHYVTLCLQHDVLINVDNMEELALIHSVHRRLALPRPARVTLRLTGFAAGTQSFAVGDSTFGIPVREISPVLSYLNTNRHELEFLGFSFHLYTDSLDYKAAAVQETLQLLLEARRMGLNPVILNIGGGFRISYVPNSSKWQSFLVALKESVLHRSDLVTWNRRGLGYRSEAGKISGSPKIVDHAVALPPADQLCALLRAPLAEFGDLPIASIMDELGVSLHIEPGRALLDQAGVTLGRVAFSKRSERGEPLTALEMNRTNLNAGELTLLTDPVLISRSPSVERFQTFLMGNLCVANELITPRKVCLPGMPRTGDILAFINTAAYCMDFAESPTLYQKVAEKVAVRPGDGRYRWYRDEEYVPAVLEETPHDC